MKNNQELQTDVQNAIKWEPLLHAAEIGVTAKDGVVSLTGIVDSYAKKMQAENAAQNGGKMACEKCGKTLENVKNEKGVPTPDNQAQVHHDPPIVNGGGRDSKPVILCPTCHKQEHKP